MDPKETNMKVVPISFRPDQVADLRRISDESGASIAHIVRRAVDSFLRPTDTTNVVQDELFSKLVDEVVRVLDKKEAA